MKEEEAASARGDWEQAFHWLAASELGAVTGHAIPEQDDFLRQRTKTLAILLNIIPRTEVERLPENIAA